MAEPPLPPYTASQGWISQPSRVTLIPEITWLRGAELPRLTQIETLLEGSPPTPGTTPSEPTPESSTGGQEPEERSSPVTEPQTPEPDGPPPEVAALARAAPVAPPSADVAGASGDQPTGVEGFLELIGRRRQVQKSQVGCRQWQANFSGIYCKANAQLRTRRYVLPDIHFSLT